MTGKATLVLLAFLLILVTLLAACGGAGGANNSFAGNNPGSGGQPNPAPGSAAPTVSMTPDSGSILAGQSATLTVVASNATQVVVTNNVDSSTFTLPPSGGTQKVSPAVTTTYTATATGSGGQSASATATIKVAASAINAVNHVIIMFQENRSFDHYFWNMTNYRQVNGIPINSADGKIKDGSDPDAAKMMTNNISPATGQAIAPYHTGSICTEDLTPDWAESHHEMNNQDPASAGPGSPMNGFVAVAYGLSQFLGVLADKDGHRAMGFFNEGDLNYYYFMASNFAMGDMFFSPVPSRTSANRLYIHAATSQGYVHPDTTAVTQLTAKTIWHELDDAGVSWKIYISDWGINNFTFFQFFTDYDTPARQANVVSISQYFQDVQNGTLPAVAFIETGMHTGRDEHPTNNPAPGVAVPTSQGIDVQSGAAWSAQIINALMSSPSWKDSVFFWTFDEGGGTMDHVPPLSVVSPDGIKPRDFDTTKDCFNQPCSSFDFNITGFRVPNFIVSPFAKKNYVSHTPMDYTAYLAFIEKRWGLPALTKRDASMPDMEEFFDFVNAPWSTPPAHVPAQNRSGVCDWTTE